MTTSSPSPSDDQQTPDVEQEDNFIRLNRENLYQDILNLEREDESFRQVFGTFVGRRTKSKYEGEIQSLRLENESLRRQADRLEIDKLSPEEINKRYNEDPEFARKYTEFRHGTDDLQERQETLRFVTNMGRMFAEAEQAGAPPELVDQIDKDRQDGKYDKDDSGRTATYDEALLLMQRDLMRGMQKSFSPKPEVKGEAEKPAAPTVSPKLSQVTPDTSSAKGKANNYAGLTKEKLKTLSQDEVNAIPMETLDRIMAT